MSKKANQVSLKVIGDGDFIPEVLESEPPVLVAFLAAWSHPCQVLRAVLKEVAPEIFPRVKVAIIDADDHPGLSISYGIHSIPTLLYFADGRERARTVGTVSKKAILSQLKQLTPGE